MYSEPGNQRLLKQDYVAPILKSLLQTFYGRHHELVDRYEIYISKMAMDPFSSTVFPLSPTRLLPDETIDSTGSVL